jgi:lipoprotein-releasing system permease protein
LNLPYFISKRITKNDKGGFSKTIYRIAIASIGIGLAVMIVSFLILIGFQQTVSNKIYNFSAHLLVSKYMSNDTFDEEPMSLNTELYQNYADYDFIDHVQEYSHMAGLIKTEEEVLGVVFKGVSERFDTVRFDESLIEGRFINYDDESYSKEILLSAEISRKLNLSLGDDVIMHFFQNPPRVRRLKVVGIYETNLSEYYDNKFVLGDIRLIQRLNNWPDSLAGGLEVFIRDEGQVDRTAEQVLGLINYDMSVMVVRDKYIQVFEWLQLISRQVNIFLAIILLVVCVNMVSIILILIMERTQMIGLLKAFGSSNRLIRRIFTYHGVNLVVRGLILGNVLGLGLCMIQYYFRIIPLNPRDYYMSFVPIGWDWSIVLTLNLLTLIVVSLIIMIPTLAITRVEPIKSIRFD